MSETTQKVDKKARRKELKRDIKALERNIAEMEKVKAPEEAISILRAPLREKQEELKALAPAKRNKFNAKRVSYAGENYHSRREAYFAQLLDSAGVSYTRQVKFTLIPKFSLDSGDVKGSVIKVDFVIKKSDKHKDLIIDVKGVTTPLAKFKLKLLQFQNRDAYEYLFPNTNEEVEKLANQVAKSFGLSLGSRKVEPIIEPEEKEEKKSPPTPNAPDAAKKEEAKSAS